MPRVDDLYPSKSQWLKSDDVPDEGITVTIDSYEIKDFTNDGKRDRKPVLYFKEDVKALVLIKTNAGTITQIVGSDELDDWIGHKITIVPRQVEFGGKQVWALRILLPRRQSQAAVAAQAPPKRATAARALDKAAPLAEDIVESVPVSDDDIPFVWLIGLIGTSAWMVLTHGQALLQMWQS